MNSLFKIVVFTQRSTKGAVWSLCCRTMSGVSNRSATIATSRLSINPLLFSSQPLQLPILPLSVPKATIIEPRTVIATEAPTANRLHEMLVPNADENVSQQKEVLLPELNKAKYECKGFKTHLIHIRHRKMKKHQLKKFRKRMLAQIRKIRLRREIKKEKLFRAELLTKIREAENFDAEKYVAHVLKTIDSKPRQLTGKEIQEKIRALRRQNRSNTNLVPPSFEDPVPEEPKFPKYS